MTNEAKQATPLPKYGFLLDELHRQGFLVGVGDVLKVHRYFKSLWEGPLSIGDLKAQLAALICHTPQDQKLFYAWFDKWALIIEKRTENLIAQLEPLEKAAEATTKPPVEIPKPPTEPPPPPPSTPQSQATNDIFMPSQAQKKRKGPINIQLAFPPNPIRFWNLAEFDAVLPVLREKKWVESTEWDIKASIRQTMQSGGMPKFVLKQKRQTPQYLMLIEQQSNRDHLAAFYADLAEELSRRDLNVSFYYYDITPATCWRERNNPRTHVSLEQLQGEYADARLFIVGNAETLLKPTQLEPSVVALSIWETWKETAILSPKGTGDWGRGELAIGQLFPVIPANGLGFQSLSAQWQGSEHFTPTYWQLKNPEPRTPNVADFIVAERPEDVQRNVIPLSYIASLPSWKTITPDDESQLNLLYFYLRDGGYRWLCAAALYPEIYYELTRLYADEVIAKDQALSEWEQNRLWGESLRLLLRLDWFRKGQIPTHWRGLLRDDFSIERALALQNPQFELSVKEVRRQLLDVLKLPQNTEGVPEDSYAAANQAFTQVWIESEMANNLKDIPQRMEDLQISMSDIEDAVGQQLWFVEGQKMEGANTKRAKTLHAVIVGIDKYPDGVRRLNGCVNDATDFANYFNTFCKENNIVYNERRLFDADATRSKIIDSFTHFDKAQDDDMCVFYFSGHGAQITSPPEFIDETDSMTETLVCYGQLNGNEFYLADKELAYLIYKATKSKKIHFLAVTDADHFGQETQKESPKSDRFTSSITETTRIRAQDYLGFQDYINFQPPYANYIHLTAAQSHETVKELKIEGLSRGVFTFSLVETLKETNGNINYEDLIRRVKLDVQNRVQNQTPSAYAFGLPLTTPFLGIKPKETQQTPEADPLSKKPKTGRLLFDVPKQMEVGKEYRCVVRIAHDDTPLFQNMEHTTNTPALDIRIADVMSVELTDTDTETAFTIRTLTEAQQFIDDTEMTEWLFYIKPLKENSHSLALKVAVIEPIDGKERRREQVLEEMIEVTREVLTLNEIKELVANDKLDKALEAFYDWANTEGVEDGLKNTIRILNARYNKLESDNRKAIIEHSNYTVEKSKIVNTLLLLIHESAEKKIGTPISKPTSIYISYSTKDDQYAKELKAHLMPLVRGEKITIWDDSSINAGESWDEKIKAQLEEADVVLFLVSADFIASDYLWDIELPFVEERRKLGKVQVIPIIVRECNWRETDFGKLQVLPKQGAPVSKFSDKDVIWIEIVKEIESSINKTKTESKEQETTIKAVDKEIAYLLIDLPADMNVYHEVPCRVYIGYDKETLLQQQTTYGNNQIEEIEVSNSVRIALSEKTKKKAPKKTESKAQQANFEIIEDSEKEQSISKTELTEWSFEIKPNREGEFELTFTISSVNSQNEYRKVASFDKEIEVHGNNQYQSQTLV